MFVLLICNLITNKILIISQIKDKIKENFGLIIFELNSSNYHF